MPSGRAAGCREALETSSQGLASMVGVSPTGRGEGRRPSALEVRNGAKDRGQCLVWVQMGQTEEDGPCLSRISSSSEGESRHIPANATPGLKVRGLEAAGCSGRETELPPLSFRELGAG